MDDQEETGQPAETDEDPPVDTDEKPAEKPEGEKPDPEAKPEEEREPAKPSGDDKPLNELLEREDIKRWGQSIGDRAVARAESRFKALAEKREQDAMAAEDKAERKKLVEAEDFDEIGRRDVAKSEAEERLLESLELAGGAISRATTERYAKELGEETVDRIVRETGDRGGSVVDLNTALAEESTKKAVKKATGTALEEAEKRFGDKLEARLADAGVAKRSKDAETTGPVEKVSGAKPDVRDSDEETTFEDAQDAYGRGDMSWEKFKPFRDAHDKERHN